jgi:hypothetical protein
LSNAIYTESRFYCEMVAQQYWAKKKDHSTLIEEFRCREMVSVYDGEFDPLRSALRIADTVFSSRA